MQSIDLIGNRLASMNAEVFKSQDKKMYAASLKVGEIYRAVQMGRSRSSRLATADKVLSKWGF